MKIPTIGRIGAAILGFFLGIVFTVLFLLFVPKWLGGNSKDQVEEMRVTSPSGKLDAVMTREAYGGGAGGFEWRVFIVLKGHPIPKQTYRVLFQAGNLSEEKLVWTRGNLLEIQYDVANIESFRNLWGLYEVQNVGPMGEGDFEVEVRLAPIATDYSVLSPSGAFR